MQIYCIVALEARRLVSGIIALLLLKMLMEFSLPSLATRVDQHPFLVQGLNHLQNASDPIYHFISISVSYRIPLG